MSRSTIKIEISGKTSRIEFQVPMLKAIDVYTGIQSKNQPIFSFSCLRFKRRAMMFLGRMGLMACKMVLAVFGDHPAGSFRPGEINFSKRHLSPDLIKTLCYLRALW